MLTRNRKKRFHPEGSPCGSPAAMQKRSFSRAEALWEKSGRIAHGFGWQAFIDYLATKAKLPVWPADDSAMDEVIKAAKGQRPPLTVTGSLLWEGPVPTCHEEDEEVGEETE